MLQYDILTDGMMTTMAADDNGVTCKALSVAIREINAAVTSLNTKQKSLAYTLATVKREGLWRKGQGWKSFELFCKSWNINKTDASRYSAVGAWLIKREDGKLVSKWATKTQDFTFTALAELVSVSEEQVTAWLDGDILTLKATCRQCRKAKAMLKAEKEPEAKEAEVAAKEPEAKEAEVAAKEPEAKEAEVAAKEPATVSGTAYINYTEALAALKVIVKDNPEALAACELVNEAVQSMFKAGAPAITTAA